MKKIFCFTVAAILSASALGQSVSFDAYKLAETFSASSWKSVEQSLPTLIAGLESQLKAGGATEKAAKILSEQVRLNFTRDNVTRVVAQGLTEKMTADDLKALSEFIHSPLGQKYLNFSNELATNPTYLRPLIKKACDEASQQLGLFERGSINGMCAQL